MVSAAIRVVEDRDVVAMVAQSLQREIPDGRHIASKRWQQWIHFQHAI